MSSIANKFEAADDGFWTRDEDTTVVVDRQPTRHEAFTVAVLLATVAVFCGAMVYPDRLMVPAFAALAGFVAVLFAPDCDF
jgi:hypothetical protein